MKKKTLMFFGWLVVFLSCSMAAPASSPATPRVIDQFVADLFPMARHYFWVINATQEETPREMIIDINTFVTRQPGDDPVEERYLLLILDGEVFAAHQVPVNTTVDCGKGEAV